MKEQPREVESKLRLLVVDQRVELRGLEFPLE